MAKLTIRLTESELKNMIKKSLNELDWKTYMNAAKKAYDRDDDQQRSEDFLDAAEQSYKDKYDATDYDGYGTYDLGYGRGHNPYHELRTSNDGDVIGDGDDEDYVYQRTATRFNNDYGPDVDSEIGDVYDSDVYDIARNPKQASSSSNKDFQGGSPEWNDVRDYLNGKTKYVKGKGWSNESRQHKRAIRLTEAKLRKIIYDTLRQMIK